uniref:HMG box domain-containing protein n=1 Tax=Syphacia muris TaxID=451379 RepID=A0A0N5ANY7_9BILA
AFIKVTSSPKKSKSPVRRQKRAKKDPNAPKRGKSAYMFWLGDNRSRLTKPGMSVVEVTKAAGEEWRKIKPDEKAKYEKLAADDKKRYEKVCFLFILWIGPLQPLFWLYGLLHVDLLKWCFHDSFVMELCRKMV